MARSDQDSWESVNAKRRHVLMRVVFTFNVMLRHIYLHYYHCKEVMHLSRFFDLSVRLSVITGFEQY